MKKRELKIYIFRHGQSTYNKAQRFTGWKDPHLTKLGIKQAHTIAKKLRHKKFEVAIQTHLRRSKQTLREVLKYHPECVRIIKDDRVIERNYGKLNGSGHQQFINNIGKRLYRLDVHGDLITSLDSKKRREVEHLLGEEEYNLIHRGFDIPPPGGESFAMVERRVKSFIKDLLKMMRKEKVNVAISAHGNSIRLFRKIIEGSSVKETISWIIPYDDYYEYSIKI